MYVTNGLFAPESYRKASATVVDELVNGCGAANARFDFVPDTIWGLNITEACSIHDWMYNFGETIQDKDSADRAFLNNILRLVEKRGGWLKRFRRIRARSYYVAVKYFGGPAYWAGKSGGPIDPPIEPTDYTV